jgi:hypothetical protein
MSARREDAAKPFSGRKPADTGPSRAEPATKHVRTLVVAVCGAFTAALALAAQGAAKAALSEVDDSPRAAAVAALKAAKSNEGARLGATLALMQKAAARKPQDAITRDMKRKLPALRASNGYVSVSAYGDDLAALRAQLVAKGLTHAAVHGTAVSGRAPVSALRDMAGTSGLKFLRPTLVMARGHLPSQGRVVSQGDRSLRADLARRESGATGRARSRPSRKAPRSRVPRTTSAMEICRATCWCSRTWRPLPATTAPTKVAP